VDELCFLLLGLASSGLKKGVMPSFRACQLQVLVEGNVSLEREAMVSYHWKNRKISYEILLFWLSEGIKLLSIDVMATKGKLRQNGSVLYIRIPRK
jgi:hypothetical protein